MAPSPEYDKEPKAPDKTTTNTSCEDPKVQHNSVNDQQINLDHKISATSSNTDVENNKDVETLDDGQLRALLDEAITYKCPKDREGKSSLFKELLEEVELDEQACEAAARSLGGCRGSKRGVRSRRALPHSNSLQDLVAALAAEPARRHHPRHSAPAPAHSSVSARAIHGGSLPSGVDTSSLLNEEPARGAGYLATVRCVNPPPLAERRVSASDANAPQEMELLNRRSKPMFPMTYTARATLEIGSGSVCSGRAVTTTTASNQVRTSPSTLKRDPEYRDRHDIDTLGDNSIPWLSSPAVSADQTRLMSALRPRYKHASDRETYQGGGGGEDYGTDGLLQMSHNKDAPRGPKGYKEYSDTKRDALKLCNYGSKLGKGKVGVDWNFYVRINSVDQWYQGLVAYSNPRSLLSNFNSSYAFMKNKGPEIIYKSENKNEISLKNIDGNEIDNSDTNYKHKLTSLKTFKQSNYHQGKLKTQQSNSQRLLQKSQPECIIDDIKKTSFKKQYETPLGSDQITDISSHNPKNIRKMTIGEPLASQDNSVNRSDVAIPTKIDPNINDTTKISIACDNILYKHINEEVLCQTKTMNNHDDSPNNGSNSSNILQQMSKNPFLNEVDEQNYENNYMIDTIVNVRDNQSAGIVPEKEIELIDIPSTPDITENSFSEYMSHQQQLLQALNDSNSENYEESTYTLTEMDKNDIKDAEKLESLVLISDLDELSNIRCFDNSLQSNLSTNVKESGEKQIDKKEKKCRKCNCTLSDKTAKNESTENNTLVPVKNDTISTKQYILAELPNNACLVLTLSKRLLTPLCNSDNQTSSHIEYTENINKNDTHSIPDESGGAKLKKKKDKTLSQSNSNNRKRDAFNKNALKALMFENFLKFDGNDKKVYSKQEIINNEVDSAIPFSCITTPEVVTSCNTTSSSQSAVAVDPKPRSVITSSFNGLPLSRPNYGSTALTASDDYKKSLDENGNAVQTYSSSLAGSTQHKKPRRKKSSKNETVIDCRQIDGYQGDKDVNELLRFIESNAESVRAPKLGRAKHRDDTDDKSTKKRSTERRKDKDKVKRASSLEELSRTTIEELTGPRPQPAPAKPERRSWGDTRDAPTTGADPPPDPAPELTDFQTVTKKRKQRRRTDEPASRRSRAPSPPSPPSPRAAPASDRSNDSNDDLDSVHSLPALQPPANSHASYADIARTRHNIPDLIESCNFYTEGEAEPEAETAETAETAEVLRAPDLPSVPPPPPGSEGYPALEARVPVQEGPKRARDQTKRPPPSVRRDRKERQTAQTDAQVRTTADCPAPDVVSDRRPAVILLDSRSRPRDMDGVTFGFDINEQLLGGNGTERRPRCDLVRDALEAGGTVPVNAGCLALRYIPPDTPTNTHHLHQIIEYVATAWEDVIRCGNGKVRYFSE